MYSILINTWIVIPLCLSKSIESMVAPTLSLPRTYMYMYMYI